MRFVACVLPVVAVLTVGVCLTNLIMTLFLMNEGFTITVYLLFGALGVTILLNFVSSVLGCVYLREDPGFVQFNQ